MFDNNHKKWERRELTVVQRGNKMVCIFVLIMSDCIMFQVGPVLEAEISRRDVCQMSPRLDFVFGSSLSVKMQNSFFIAAYRDSGQLFLTKQRNRDSTLPEATRRFPQRKQRERSAMLLCCCA